MIGWKENVKIPFWLWAIYWGFSLIGSIATGNVFGFILSALLLWVGASQISKDGFSGE